jgi:hypothetical protein
MPALTYAVMPAGLAVPVWVALDGPAMAALQSRGKPIPAPILLRGLLDTCADVTAVALDSLVQLGALPVASVQTMTAGGMVTVSLYQVSLSIAGPAQLGGFALTEPALRVTELAVALPDADVLIGLDLLLSGKLLLDGPAAQFTLDY